MNIDTLKEDGIMIIEQGVDRIDLDAFKKEVFQRKTIINEASIWVVVT